MAQYCDECRSRIRQGFPDDGRLFCTITCLEDFGLPPKLKQRNNKRRRRDDDE